MTRIYYGDGSTWDTATGAPPPPRDVQAILQSDPVAGVAIETGKDYYVRQAGRWVGVDIFGLFDFLLDSGLVLFGRTITNDEYTAIVNAAKADKSAWLARERRPKENPEHPVHPVKVIVT